MKHISLIALVVAFSVNSFAKDIFCASKDESILLSVVTQDQAVNGFKHADTMLIQRSADQGQLKRTEDVAGGIDLNNNKAYFIARINDASMQATVRLNIESYTDQSSAVLDGTLKIDQEGNGFGALEGIQTSEYQMSCVTELNIGF